MLNETENNSKAIIGWRSWKVDAENNLIPLTVHYFPWLPGVNSAFCGLKNRGGRLHSHASPEASCECGLYAYHHPNPNWDAEDREPFVFGLVLGKGKTEIHEPGFRSAEMQIAALVYTGFQDESVVHEVGEKYRVEVFPMREALELRKNLIYSGLATSLDQIGELDPESYCDPRRTYNRAGQLQSFKDKPSVVDFMGNKFWHDKGLLHRDDDKPAIVYSNRNLWSRHGIPHHKTNVARPAYIIHDCYKIWYKRGLVHRDNDLPAIIRANGVQEWWQKGIRFRSGGKSNRVDPNRPFKIKS